VKWEPYFGFTFQSSFEVTQALIAAMADLSEKYHAKFIVTHGQMLDLLQLVIKKPADDHGVPLHNLDRALLAMFTKSIRSRAMRTGMRLAINWLQMIWINTCMKSTFFLRVNLLTSHL